MHISRYSVLTIFIAQSLSLSAATAHIKNLSKEPVLALIGDQTSAGWKEEDKAEVAFVSAATGIMTLGMAPIAMAIGGVYSSRANTKLIKPGQSRFFNNDLSPIKKVTFMRIRSDIPPTPYVTGTMDRVEKVINYTLKKYGFPPFRQSDKKPPSMRSRDFYRIEDSTIYALYIPKVDTFTINPDIGRLIVEARIEYYGWENAKRIKK